MLWTPVWISFLLTLALAVDYYEVLGVKKDATERELKKAYRSLSRQYHPDKNRGDDTAQQKFIEVAEAYEILSDPEQRRIFDRFGSEGLKNGGAGFGAMHHDPMDLFKMSFGNMFQSGAGVKKGPNSRTVLPVTLKNLYKQDRIDFEITQKVICDECDGTGSSDGVRDPCDQCGGVGQRIIRHQLAPGMIQQIQTTCDRCGGSGTVIQRPCSVCHGNRVVDEARKFNVFLEPGRPREFDYVFEGEANQDPSWTPGDIYVHVQQTTEDNMGYRRRGNDLFREEVLSAKQAALGAWSREITRLDETSTFTLSRKQGEIVFNDMVERIPGEGMPIDSDTYGDLYIRYKVVGGALEETLAKHAAHSEL